MKKTMLIAMIGFLSVAGLAQAHTHLEKAEPADNAVLASSPDKLTLRFSEATQLTALTIQKAGEAQQKEIEALPKVAATEHTLPLASLAPGNYTVNWRAIGADSHVVTGSLHFTVRGK